ncbi:MAG: endonuclease domain-containing protein [Candidatus Uhrbacteria bacterium]|nr:endonuclease domain-containing protein [Candidatus Uhrbacteria bacterium]
MTEVFNKLHHLEMRRELRQQSTQAEKLFWKQVRSGQLGIRIKRQVGIGEYIVDFYAPNIRLAIELDGGSHFEIGTAERDADRQKNIEVLGIKVIRFTDNEVFDGIDDVISILRNAIEERRRSFVPKNFS